jgi:D-lactate dehydrogenase (cytochrome)
MDEVLTGIYQVDAHKEGMRIVEGSKRIQEEYPDYLRDESNAYGFGVEKLFFPQTPENVSYVVREAVRSGKSVTISGGRTGICAGAVAEGGWLLSLEKMKRVLGLSRRSGYFELTVESGMRISELGARIKSKELGLDGSIVKRFLGDRHSFFYPPDPTETTAMLGGTVATNASGARTFHYGPTRRWIAGMDIIMASGDMLRIRRGEVREKNGYLSVKREGKSQLRIPFPGYDIPRTKHSAGLYSKRGMDLIDLFVGSEGILGVIVDVTVIIIPEPPSYIGGVAFFSNEDQAVDFVISARSGEPRPLALEYFDANSLQLLQETRRRQGPTSEIPAIPEIDGRSMYAVYFECAGEEEDDVFKKIKNWKRLIEKSGGDSAVSWGAVSKRDLLRLKSFRHTLPETVNEIIAQNKARDARIHKIGTDMAVPDECLIEMLGFYRDGLARERLRHVIFGHIGNNHLHVNMIPGNYSELERAKELYRTFARKAVTLGGTVSAEHGIGKLKREYLSLLYGKEEIKQMMAIKHLLDPGEILNPGNIFYAN